MKRRQLIVANSEGDREILRHFSRNQRALCLKVDGAALPRAQRVSLSISALSIARLDQHLFSDLQINSKKLTDVIWSPNRWEQRMPS